MAIIQVIDRRPALEAEAELARLAFEDAMTGLLNRRGFDAVAHQLLEVAKREQRGVTFMFIDVEGLKVINDEHGHAVGDRVIATAGEVLRSAFRDADAVGRYGGDEFCVLGLTATERSAEQLRDRLDEAVAQTVIEHDGIGIPFALTVGTVHAPAGAVPPLPTLVDRADREMYRQRRSRTG